MKKGLDQKLKEDWQDIDRLYELSLIDRDEWSLARWRLVIGAFELVSGHWVAKRFPNLHVLITSWIGEGNFNYHIDRDLVLRCSSSRLVQLPEQVSIKTAWLRLLPKNF